MNCWFRFVRALRAISASRVERIERGIRVQSRECSAVAGVHRLKQVIAAFVADFAHDDAVGTMTESRGHKLARSDGNLARNRCDGLPANGVGMGDLQLGWLFDHNQPFMERNMIEQRFHQGCLA